MEKSIHELKVEVVHLCVRERKKSNSFEITVIIFRAYKKCKSPVQKEFLKGLLTNTSFFLYFRDRPKNGEGKKKRRRKYICARVTKHTSKKVAKAEVKMN